jgi:chloramphenicol-sensitive protein RarD
MRQGLLAAICAYLIWGLFPLYWKLLAAVPALEIMAHRIVWCALFVGLWLTLRDGWGWLRQLSPRLLALLGASALLIGFNWWLYIWAINADHIVETSLGYFINPLINVLLGVAVMRERLRPAQWLAVAIAAAGVLWLAIQAGRPPWIALGLGLSFGGYGLIRKLAVIASLKGLMVESGLLLLPALGYLGWLASHGQGGFGHLNPGIDTLLVLGGLVTALPLVLFAIGARSIPLSLMGFLQYLTPSILLLCGVFLYKEPFSSTQAIGFGCIWTALLIYAIDGLIRSRQRPQPA